MGILCSCWLCCPRAGCYQSTGDAHHWPVGGDRQAPLLSWSCWALAQPLSHGQAKKIEGLGIFRSSRGGVWLSCSWITVTEPPLLCQVQTEQTNQAGQEFPESSFLKASGRSYKKDRWMGVKLFLASINALFAPSIEKLVFLPSDRNKRIDPFTTLIPKHKSESKGASDQMHIPILNSHNHCIFGLFLF